MKVIIAGGRDFNNKKLFLESVKNMNITEVVCGKAKGADTMGENWAKDNNMKITYFDAEWDLYGKGAGFIRNEEMAKYADYLLAFWDENSKGTKHMIQTMKKLRKPSKVVLYNIKDDEW